ncbi:MAG: GldG family protein, partial [Pseudomonadota bacterium]
MSTTNKKMSKTISYTGLFILAVLFIVINMLSTNLFNGMRIDLTQNKLYTLSEGTLKITESIQEPITFNYFFSDQASRDIPQIRTYATRVRELLQEYAQLSNGKITLHVIDPVAYSEQEDQANEYGLQGVPIGPGGETLYFGLAASNSVGESEVIPFFQPDKEQFLEYDITKLIYSLSSTKKPVIGVLSRIPMFSSFDVETQRVRDPWVVIRQLQQLYEVRNIDVAATEFDEDLELLMVVFPKDLSNETLYAIDQYVMNGGNLIVYVDPYAESFIPVRDPNSPLEAEGARSSNLALLDAYGIDYSPDYVVGDRRYALTVEEEGREVRHYALLGLDKDAFQNSDVIMSGLDVITMGIAGTVKAKSDSDIEFEPLMHSSNEAMLYETSKFRFLPKVSSLAENFQPTGTKYTLAGRFQLQPESAFSNPI